MSNQRSSSGMAVIHKPITGTTGIKITRTCTVCGESCDVEGLGQGDMDERGFHFKCEGCFGKRLSGENSG